MLLLLTTTISSRLRYIADLLFTEMYGIPVDFTQSVECYTRYDGPKIAYLKEYPGDGLFIEPSGLLFEHAVFPHEITLCADGDVPYFFPSGRRETGFPFDILAASFYLVSRYEEHLPGQCDKYGRFPAAASLAARGGFLERPVINIWMQELVKRLRKTWPGLATRQPPYGYISTIDVDHAYAFLHRPLFRTLGGIGRSLSHGHPGEVFSRLATLAGLSRDPYDTYQYIRAIHNTLGIGVTWFILFADYGGDDNNIPVGGRGMKNLVEILGDGGDHLGIHPSLSSNKHLSRLKREKEGLEELTGRPVTSSRQHFLKFTFPETFHRLELAGITDEFSMGYASHPGFRAGIANPFRFYDLSRNEPCSLRIHPVQVMDITFRDYLKLDPEESFSRIQEVIRQVRAVNGQFVSLWHNESLSEAGRWKQWRWVFEQMVTYAIP
jgi:hypothetical protein